MQIIGLSGYKGSGKDTVARIITGRFPALSGWHRIAFADAVREAVAAMYGFTMRQMLDPVLKERVDDFWGVSPREALRSVGMERRAVRNDFWLMALERRMSEIMRRSMLPVKGFVIPDVRFENELDFVRDHGGKTWVIHRPGCEYDGHITEALPRDSQRFDRILNNDRDLRSLRQTVRYMMSI